MRKKDDGKQRKIKEAVIKLILTEGFHGTSISKIAKEAGVSPATVYIYYENKEAMLQDIYMEYSEDVFYYLLENLNETMDGTDLIHKLISNYYIYINENDEIFHFVEQFSSCPALAAQCNKINGINCIYNLFDELKAKNVMKNYRNENLLAIIFSPVKYISTNQCCTEEDKKESLIEMIKIIQDTVLVK